MGEIPTTFTGWVSFLVERFGPQFVKGTITTLQLAFLGTVLGCLLGFLVGIVQSITVDKHSSPLSRGLIKVLKAIVAVYVEVFRGTPMILQAVFIFFGLPYFFGNGARLDVTPAAYLVVSINTGAYMAETVRGGIMSIDPGQTEGAKAIGMNHFKTMTSVILPQTIRNIIPQIGNNLIINIKDTSVMFIIGYTELFAVHKAIVGAKFVYFPSAVIEMAMYLCMTIVCSVLLRWWERKLDGPQNFDIATTDTLALTSGMTTYVKKERKEDMHR